MSFSCTNNPFHSSFHYLACRFFVALACTVSLQIANVSADAVFVYEGAGFDKDAQIIVREGKVVFGDVDESNLGFIYDTNVDLFHVLNHRQKSYTQLSGEAVETMALGMQAFLPQLQELAKESGIDGEQGELIDKLIKQLSNNNDVGSSDVEVAATDGNRSVLGLTCDEYAVSYQASAYDVCAIDYSKIGLSNSDKQSLQQLSIMLKRLASTVQLHEAQVLATVLGHMDGVILEALDDNGDSLMRLKHLTLTARSSSDGEVPRGYTETDLLSVFSGL